jgi:hypothetical protein
MKSVKNNTLLLAIILSFFYKISFAQCSVSSAQPPATVTETNLSGSDFEWDNANDVLTSNDDYAYAGATLTLLNPSKYSDYMSLTNFNMSIPAAVTICGIVVQIDRKASGLSLAAVVDSYCLLGGSVQAIITPAEADGREVNHRHIQASSDLWGLNGPC